MKLERLYLRNFRNYEEAEISLDPGVNLILGNNAQGKTNLLEAVSYLSTGKSFRTRKEAELIRFGEDFCEITANIHSCGRQHQLRAVLFASRKKRQLFLSDVKQKSFSDKMAGLLNSVLFCPEDLLVLKTGASGRRKLIDTALCQLRPYYDTCLTEYHRLLEHKSRILKDWHEDRSLLDLLPDFNERMCRLGAEIIHSRQGYLALLAASAERYHEAFSGNREKLRVEYRTVSNIQDPSAAKLKLYESLKEHMESHYRAETESGQCLSGPHKDDFDVFLNEIPLKNFGSQGQTRTAAISLKLAERDIFREDTGQEPVLLLDDVLSELDEGRQDFILNHIEGGQVLITCCEQDRVTNLGKTIEIAHGTVQ